MVVVRGLRRYRAGRDADRSNLKLRGIASGFDYLRRTAGFEIAPGPLPYSSRDTYTRALEVGLVNTLRVSLLGIVVADRAGTA